jgi:hypothetical protein
VYRVSRCAQDVPLPLKQELKRAAGEEDSDDGEEKKKRKKRKTEKGKEKAAEEGDEDEDDDNMYVDDDEAEAGGSQRVGSSKKTSEKSRKAAGRSKKAAEGLKKAAEELNNEGISRRDWAALPTLAEMLAGVTEVEKEFPEASPWAVAFFIGRELVQQGRERAEREERAVGAIERAAAAAEEMSATAKVIRRYQGRMENELSELVGYVYADKTWAAEEESESGGSESESDEGVEADEVAGLFDDLHEHGGGAERGIRGMEVDE